MPCSLTELEARERLILAPYAQFSADTRGHRPRRLSHHASGVTRVVRGRDIAPSTMVQAGLQRVLGLPSPTYRHHLLLLEGAQKHSKFHGAVGAPVLRARYGAEDLCGLLAAAAGLQSTAQPCTPSDLLPGFAWDRVRTEDTVLTWDGQDLRLTEP